ncbi:PrpR N-terminal domain-containing protein [Planococcus koreensis]|uniref:PrpR N-terminal domain-containing protein n=1 Tax=Planococcus koreensis TaxID=112331 RepID=UPI0039FBFD87
MTVEAAERLGMEGLLIQSGRESVMEAIEEARRLISTMEKAGASNAYSARFLPGKKSIS